LHGVPGHPVYENATDSRKRQYDVVRRYQDRFVDKLLSVTLPHDNVLYCMNNETHEDPAWGHYWMDFIRRKAREMEKQALATDMFDDAFNAETSRGLTHQFRNRDKYDYIDISQANSRHRDESHWNTVRWIIETAKKTEPPYLAYMTKIYGNDLALDRQPWSRFKPGDSDNGIEEWWRNLLAGVAGVRFHRPTAGIGLSAESKACIRATRRVESRVKFWDVKPHLELLSNRDPDEAYLAADPGRAYILYFTKNGAGSVGLNLQPYRGHRFELVWVNIDTGNPGPTAMLSGGSTPIIDRPDDSAHWVATLVETSG
jgi:hypothetical protein